MYSAQELISCIESLAALPTVYYRVREQLESPESSIGKVARLLEADPALTVSILKLVNSAFYGFGRRIESVERAIPILGLQQTLDVVLTISVSNAFEGICPTHMDMRRYWLGCMMAALTARELAFLTCNPAAGRLFVIGLLADIGHLVMYQTIPELAMKSQTIADTTGEPLHEVERRLIGCHSAEVSAVLLDNWKLPDSFGVVVGAQFNPALGGKYRLEAELIHIATTISRADRYNESTQDAVSRINPCIWKDINIPPENFPHIREAVEMNLSTCTALFFPSTLHQTGEP